MLERLHKILARAGVAALRPAEDMILEGRITVNGRVVRELGARADTDADVITVDGVVLDIPQPTDPRQYVMLHKPVGVISTAHDTHGRPTVVDLVPNGGRIFPVGRLDADSEGLLLLTDDGDLAYRLTHPRFEVDKEYRVLVDLPPQLPELRRWRTGVELDDEMTAPAWVEVLDRTDDGTWLRIVMREGRKRQIREVARILGMNVRRLIRVREGPLALGDLAPGSWRTLSQTEIESLRTHTQHVPSREADEERERKMSEQDGRRRRLRVIRRPAREDAAYERPTQESTSTPMDESSEFLAAGNMTDFENDLTDEAADTGPAQPQSAERRERSRFDQGRPNEQTSRGNDRSTYRGDSQPARGGRGGNDRSDNRQERGPQSDRAPYAGRGNQQRPYGERSSRPDDRNRSSYSNERDGGENRDRAPYGNDRNGPPNDSFRDRGRNGPSSGGSRDRNAPSGGGFRDRNGPSSGGFRDRNGPSGGGFRDRNSSSGGGFRSNGPSGGGFRDRNGPSGGGFRSNGPSGGGFRDRNGPSGGGSRDRNGPSGGGFRDRNGPSGGSFRDRNGPSGGGFRSNGPSSGSRNRSGSAGGGFRERDAGGFRDSRPTYRDDRASRPSFDRDRRGPDGNARDGGPRSNDRGFGRAPRSQGGDSNQGGGFKSRGPRQGGSFNDRPARDNSRGFDRRPADFNPRRRDDAGNTGPRQGGPPSNSRFPRSGGNDRGFGRAPSQDRGPAGQNRRDTPSRPSNTGSRPRDDDE